MGAERRREVTSKFFYPHNNAISKQILTQLTALSILQVYNILDEYMLAGEIAETSKKEILERVRLLEKLE